MVKVKTIMPEENDNQPAEQPQDSQPLGQQSVVVGSSTEQQLQPQIASRPIPPVEGDHKLLKLWLVVSLVILILNAGLLALTLIPFAGVYIAIGAAPILLGTGALGLINIFVASRSLSKNYVSGGLRKVATMVLVLSVLAVLGGASSPFILATQHKENAKTEQIQNETNSKYSVVTVEKATELLNSCQVYQLSYSNGKGSDWEKSPETSTTGILIYNEPTKYGAPSPTGSGYVGGTYIMYPADRMVSTIVPIARQAQSKCGIQFNHDGASETWKDGHWYFKDVLVK